MTTTTAFEDANIQNLLETIAKDEEFKQPSFSISAGSNPGDNYCCRMYRVVITEVGGSKTLSLIFKVSIPRKSSRKNAIYQKGNKLEENAYKKILPALNNILKKYGLSECDHFPRTAKYYASYQDDSCQVLVIGDKCVDGFRTLGEVKFLDVDHCRQILRSIALIHAASIALRKHDPEAFEMTKSHLSPEGAANANLEALFEEMQENAAAGLKLLPESFKKKSSFIKMEKAAENFLTLIAKANEVPPDFSCIIHGDCWYNNALYKYSEDNDLEEICLIDFQGIRLASPATELSYMFFICTQKEMRDESYEDLIRFYHVELSALLTMMDCDDPEIIPQQVLEEHMKKYGQMGPLMAAAGLSIHLIDCLEEPVYLKFSEDEDSLYSRREKLPPSKERKEIIENILMNVIEDAYARGFI